MAGGVSLRWLIAAALVLVFAGPRAGPAQDDLGDTRCGQVLTCDCENIQAGILNLGWIPDCRECQRELREACNRVDGSVPFYRALIEGGYCETDCSVAGPAPYPPAPDGAAAEPTPEAAARPRDASGEITLACPLGGVMTAVQEGDLSWYGCVDEDGRRVGIWVAIDAEGRVVAEAAYGADGQRVVQRLVE
jgi:hypothetical protein